MSFFNPGFMPKPPTNYQRPGNGDNQTFINNNTGNVGNTGDSTVDTDNNTGDTPVVKKPKTPSLYNAVWRGTVNADGTEWTLGSPERDAKVREGDVIIDQNNKCWKVKAGRLVEYNGLCKDDLDNNRGDKRG